MDFSCAMGAATGGGDDAKCYSLPQMHSLGLTSPRVISASDLPFGGAISFTLGIVWTGATQGAMIDISSFGAATSSKYFISLQADSGPQADLSNMYQYQATGLSMQLYRKVYHKYGMIVMVTQRIYHNKFIFTVILTSLTVSSRLCYVWTIIYCLFSHPHA